MKTRMLLVTLSALALGLAIALGEAGDAPDFSHYPQTDNFIYRSRQQTNGVAQLAQSNLLVIQFLFKPSAIDVGYTVKQNGLEEDGRLMTYAVQAVHKRQLSAESMNRLRQAIGELPSHNETPPLDRLVVVSFKNGTNWITRSYDEQAPPAALGKIYDIIEKTPQIGF